MLGHEAHTARGIDEVVNVDCASGGRGTHRPVLICSSDRAAGSVIICKIKGGDLGVLKDGNARCGSVAEEELIKLQVNDVPCAMVFKEGVKVRE